MASGAGGAVAHEAGAVIGQRERVVAALEAPMLAMIRERPGVSHSRAARYLKDEGRIKPGVRAAESSAACERLAERGLIVREGAWGWRAV